MLRQDHATETDLSGTSCSAWSDNACCTRETAAAFRYDVADVSTGLYDGHGMGISQCGIPSTDCQKWFIAESCMYECDVNAGRYRHHSGDAACEEANNGWQMAGFPLKQSEMDQFYTDCAADTFCFGTVDTCTGTPITANTLYTADGTSDACEKEFAAGKGWGMPAACDGSDPVECAAACPAGCAYGYTTTANTAAVDSGRGFWDRASACGTGAGQTNEGCARIDAAYTDGTEAVAELWAYEGVPAFTVVATAAETATNSFSFFGGDAMTDSDFTDAPANQVNTNDAVLLTGTDARLFPATATCTHTTNCSVSMDDCTVACEAADARTFTTTAATYGGSATCPADPTAVACGPGDGTCAATLVRAAPSPSGAHTAMLPSMLAAAAGICAAFVAL